MIDYQNGLFSTGTGDRLPERSTNSWSKLASAITPVDRNVVDTAFALLAFRQAGHQWATGTPEEVNLTVTAITTSNPPPAPSVVPIRGTRNSSTEPSAFPDDWSTNRTAYRAAVKAFHSITAQYRLSPQYRSYLLKSEVDEKQSSLSDTSSSIGGTPPQSGPTAPRPKTRYLTDIDDSPISGRNSKEPTSTTHSISDFGSQPRSISQQATETSVDEAIYENPIGPNTMPTDPNIQAAIDAAVSAGMERVLTRMQKMLNDATEQRKQQKPPDPSEPPGEPGSDDTEVGDSTPRWNPAELSFYDPNYDGKTLNNDDASMEHAEKNTYFRNVHLFVIRAKETAMTKDSQLVKNNLWTCLKNTALKWYIDELNDTDRRMLRMTMNDENDLIEWITRLIDRFKEFSNITF